MALKTEEFCLDFVGIGAARSGTTWLAQMLAVHPDIFIPPQKELNYFNGYFPESRNINHNKPPKWYVTFFKAAQSHQLKGEISPSYLSDKCAAKAIYRFNSEIKIIVVLRNPVERLLSLCFELIRKGKLDRFSIEKMFKIPHIPGFNRYHIFLKKYFDLFPKENIKVTFYDDLVRDNVSFLKDIQSFLNVNHFIPQTINDRVNVASMPQFLPINRLLYRFQFFLRKNNIRVDSPLIKYFSPILTRPYRFFTEKKTKPYAQKPQLDEKHRNVLLKYYLKDIEDLEQLLDVNLDEWKK